MQELDGSKNLNLMGLGFRSRSAGFGPKIVTHGGQSHPPKSPIREGLSDSPPGRKNRPYRGA